ncbi:DEAD/DEAH box helicase [Archangium gephyra]|nr:DEAD/DEAH box helicase [Archangium gephyra]
MTQTTTLEQLRTTLADRRAIAADPFSVAKAVAKICNKDPSSTIARELVIRALENRDLFESLCGIIDMLARIVGLFPYIDEKKLSTRDRLAYEYHRPLDLKLQSKPVVFHREQAKVYRGLLDGNSYVLSAPTSFGKSLIVDALIASNQYQNIVIIVPTIALIDETRRRLNRFRDTYKIITHPDQRSSESNIYILTQERALDRKDLTDISLLIIDEFYKLDPTNEDESDRASALNHALYKLRKTSKQIYLLGPHISEIPEGFGARFECQFKRTDFNTVVSQVHQVSPHPTREEAFIKLCQRLDKPTLIYCKSPKQANEVMRLLVNQKFLKESAELKKASDWLATTFHKDWTLCQSIIKGVGVHHGRLPRALAQLMVEFFNNNQLHFLICTSSLIEGVNTSAKNVIIFEGKIGKQQELDYFTFRNIQGRAGRMRRHFIGDVYIFDPAPAEQSDFVDIPVFTQGESTPLGLLVQLDEQDLKPGPSKQVNSLKEQSVLSFSTLQKNAHINPNDQLSLANELIQDRHRLHPLMSWRGKPQWEPLQTACDLIFRHFVKTRRSGVSSGRQLAFRVRRLSETRSTKDFIKDFLEKDKFIKTPDEAVEAAFEFQRNWAGFIFPRFLGALDRIQKEIFGRFGLPPGDYSFYATLVEHLFLEPEISALEEYGLPTEVGRKLKINLELNRGLDKALESLKQLNLNRSSLMSFERELVDRCRSEF